MTAAAAATAAGARWDSRALQAAREGLAEEKEDEDEEEEEDEDEVEEEAQATAATR